jgi:hypothetical protein
VWRYGGRRGSFVSDIFNEVDEELRREQFKKLWERYGILIIALAVLFVAAVGGWRGYQWWEAKKAAEAGAAFDAAATLSQQGQHQEAEAAFAKIAVEGTPNYRMLAKLREAAMLAQRDPQAAVAIYDAIAADRSLDQMQRDLAALRAAYILVDTASYDELKNRLEPLTASGRPFRHSARSLLALAAWRANNTAEMRRWIDMVLADPETPTNTRNQVEMLVALAGADGKS